MKKRVILAVLSCLFCASITNSIVLATSGGIDDDGISYSCTGSFICSTYGATWRWYSTSENDVDLKDYTNFMGDKNPAYANGGRITGCGSIGGYYRYGMVAMEDAKDGAGRQWRKGDQVGMTSIANHTDKGFDSKHFPGGGMVYRASDGTSWDIVKEAYLDAKANKPSVYPYNWAAGSSLAWFCYANRSFKAKATVSDATTNWVIGSDADGKNVIGAGATSKAISCNSTSGCNVNFKFDLKTIVANGTDKSTTYTIQKRGTGNWSDVAGYVNKTISPGTSGSNVLSITPKIIAGETLCYRIKYKPHGSFSSNEYRYVQACAYGTGTVGSSIDLKIKRETDSNYSAEVWVKPTDKVNLLGSYTPVSDTIANQVVKKLTVGSQSVTETGSVKNLYNKHFNPDWNNAFSIQIKKGEEYGDLSNGESEYDYQVASDAVGKSVIVRAVTNSIEKTKTAPKSVKIGFDAGLVATVDTNSISSDERRINVPYNFTNSISFEDSVKTVLYAGESDSVKGLVITVVPKENKTVNSTYATIVRKPKVEVRLCYRININDEETCEIKIKEYDSLNGGNDVDIFKANSYSVDEIAMNIPDVPAGTKMCVRASVYPATSGADTNYQDPEGDHQWSEAAEKCYIVAKRPSLQVWGGNIYSNGDITTTLTSKKRLASINDGKANDNIYTFGSWGELGIISNGEVTGLASGAGLGYTGINDDGTLVQNPGGLIGNDFCKMSTLSFANDKCSEEIGLLGATLPLANDKESIKNRLEDLKNSGVNVIMPNKGEENVYIDENIINMDPANTLDDLPKTVVYAENDIYIRCEEEEDSTVTRIDAVLIAENNVVTCADQDGKEPDINSRRRSHRLVINGAVIAGKLIANRTYGAATGDYSMVPAEIINFDPTLYLWGNIGTGDDNTTNINMTTNYIRELPPRY